jgi:hypothetical protein
MIWFSHPQMRLQNFIMGFICLLDAMIMICSLGFVGTSFQFTFACHMELKKLNRIKEGK